MVQVDVFWSYGLGASFALGAWRQLRRLKAERDGDAWKLVTENKLDVPAVIEVLKKKNLMPKQLDPDTLARARRYLKDFRENNATAFGNEYFMKTLIFLSLLFVPSGAVLLWSNPSWETMQVGKYETIPQWLVGLFSITNVTQGIAGFLVTHDLMMKGKLKGAALQTYFAYLLFFFTLVNGWDNKAYQRFFSKNREGFDDWRWSNIFGWATSDVAAILIAFGVVFLPLMYYWVCRWMVEGQLDEQGVISDPQERVAEATRLFGQVNLAIFGGALGTSIAGTVLIRKLGWAPGLLATAGITTGLLAKNGAADRMLKKIMRVDDLRIDAVSPVGDATKLLEEALAAQPVR
ncbi:MAG: hypothetical protein ACYC55_04625 [Candidatus Geothermincolia bacterium]